MNGVSRWRIAAAMAVVAALVALCSLFAPIYYRSYQFRAFLSTVPAQAQRLAAQGGAPSDQAVLQLVISRAKDLGLPVRPEDVRVERMPPGGTLRRIAVHYRVPVSLPGYSVDLHFNPQAAR